MGNKESLRCASRPRSKLAHKSHELNIVSRQLFASYSTKAPKILQGSACHGETITTPRNKMCWNDSTNWKAGIAFSNVMEPGHHPHLTHANTMLDFVTTATMIVTALRDGLILHVLRKSFHQLMNTLWWVHTYRSTYYAKGSVGELDNTAAEVLSRLLPSRL